MQLTVNLELGILGEKSGHPCLFFEWFTIPLECNLRKP